MNEFNKILSAQSTEASDIFLVFLVLLIATANENSTTAYLSLPDEVLALVPPQSRDDHRTLVETYSLTHQSLVPISCLAELSCLERKVVWFQGGRRQLHPKGHSRFWVSIPFSQPLPRH